MGQKGDLKSQTQEPPAESSVGCTKEEHRLPQGPNDLEAHLSSRAQTDSTDNNLSKAFHPASRNQANAKRKEVLLNVSVSDSSFSNCDGNSGANPNDFSEEVSGHSGSHDTCDSPLSSDSHAQKNPKFSAREQTTAPLKGEVTSERDSTDVRLEAHSQEISKTYEGMQTLFREWNNNFHKDEGLFSKQEKEIAILKREKQQYQEVITKLHFREGQVVELQGMICELKTEIGKLSQEVNSQLSFKDELLESEIGKAFGQIFCTNRALHLDFLNCQTKLESESQCRTIATEQMLGLEEVNCKLKQKVESIQKQLCKERAGQHGAYVDGQQTPFLLESTAKEMFLSVSAFSALLSKCTGLNGHNPVQSYICGSDIWRTSHVTRLNHWKYILKKLLSDHFFLNFESEKFVRHDNSVLFLDHEERVRKCFEYFNSCKNEGAIDRAFYQESNNEFDKLFFVYLGKVCLDLLPSLLPQDVQSKLYRFFKARNEFTKARLTALLSGLALDQRKLVESFIHAAEKVWQFHKLCLSFELPATIFRVPSGITLNEQFMESTDSLENNDGISVPSVAFMVYPGFRLRKSIIKCEVYVAVKKT